MDTSFLTFFVEDDDDDDDDDDLESFDGAEDVGSFLIEGTFEDDDTREDLVEASGLDVAS